MERFSRSIVRRIGDILQRRRTVKPELQVIENDIELRRSIVESARNSTSGIDTSAIAKVGDPFFDTLPEVLHVAPSGAHIRILLYAPANLGDDRETMEALTKLRDLESQRENTEIRLASIERSRGFRQ